MLTELIVRSADLLEAEGRVLRTMVQRTGMSLGLIGAACVIAACGIVLLASALFIVVRSAWGVPAAAAVCGAVLLLIAAVMLLVAGRVAK